MKRNTSRIVKFNDRSIHFRFIKLIGAFVIRNLNVILVASVFVLAMFVFQLSSAHAQSVNDVKKYNGDKIRFSVNVRAYQYNNNEKE